MPGYWTVGIVASFAFVVFGIWLLLSHGIAPAVGAWLIALGIVLAYARFTWGLIAAVVLYIVGGILVYLAFVPTSTGVPGY